MNHKRVHVVEFSDSPDGEVLSVNVISTVAIDYKNMRLCDDIDNPDFTPAFRIMVRLRRRDVSIQAQLIVAPDVWYQEDISTQFSYSHSHQKNDMIFEGEDAMSNGERKWIENCIQRYIDSAICKS